MNKCECLSWAGVAPEDWGKHHHKNCPKYHTEKFPYLFYYEEAIDAWTFAPERLDQIISITDQLDEGESMALTLKRQDYTDAEVEALPSD